MDARRLLTVLAVTIAALAALPAVAGANTVEFRGVVSGSPYGASNGYMAVPVLYSKQTARNVGLKSPVGLLVVKRSLSVPLPGGASRVLPVGLRTGDRFKGKVPMKSTYTKSFYPRITFSTVRPNTWNGGRMPSRWWPGSSLMCLMQSRTLLARVLCVRQTPLG